MCVTCLSAATAIASHKLTLFKKRNVLKIHFVSIKRCFAYLFLPCVNSNTEQKRINIVYRRRASSLFFRWLFLGLRTEKIIQHRRKSDDKLGAANSAIFLRRCCMYTLVVTHINVRRRRRRRLENLILFGLLLIKQTFITCFISFIVFFVVVVVSWFFSIRSVDRLNDRTIFTLNR